MFLAQRVPELSRTRIQELIRDGHVRVDGKIAKASHRVAAGETVEIEVLPRPAPEALPEDLPLDLLHVDDDFVIVNKPAGMVVHAGAGHSRGTLVNALLHRLGNLSAAGGALRPGIVHRLDRETSGAMVVARNDRAHEHLSEQFRSRNVRKDLSGAGARQDAARFRHDHAAHFARSAPPHAHDGARKRKAATRAPTGA